MLKIFQTQYEINDTLIIIESYPDHQIPKSVTATIKSKTDSLYFISNYENNKLIRTYNPRKEGDLIHDIFYDMVVDYIEKIDFSLDMVVGNGFDTFGLSREFIIPTEFSLSPAYPNPFNPVTTLSFAIPVDSEVSLSIYNLQGREVVSLINGNMDAGYHSVVWNADSHSSGVYFVKMVTGEFVNTQKLMLVK